MLTTIKKSPHRWPEEPATWSIVRDSKTGDEYVTIACGGCGELTHLKHGITAAGIVSPSIVCPRDGCDWHVWGKLEDWSPGRRQERA